MAVATGTVAVVAVVLRDWFEKIDFVRIAVILSVTSEAFFHSNNRIKCAEQVRGIVMAVGKAGYYYSVKTNQLTTAVSSHSVQHSNLFRLLPVY